MKTFKSGQELSARAIGDHNCIFTAKVLRRTEKTITLDLDRDGVKRVKVFKQEDGEFCYPLGQYSKAPRFKAWS